MQPEPTRPSIRLLAAALLAALLLSLVGCGSSTTESLSSARPTAAPAATAPTEASAAPTEAPTVPTAAPTAEPTTEPTAVPSPTAEPVAAATVDASGFSQDGKSLGFGVALANPNPASALEDVRLQVVAYGAGDLVLGTDESRIPVLPPAVTTFFGGSMYLDAEQPVERIAVQVTSGGKPQPATPDELPAFPVASVSYRENSITQSVSGVIANPFTVPLTDLYVGVVLYDEADQIIGGGFTFLPFLLPEGASPFSTSVHSSAAPARIAVSPLVSVLTLFSQRAADALPPLTLVEQGWGLDRQVGYGLVVENPDPDKAMESGQYLVAAYAEDGSVLAVDQGYFGLLLPGQRTAEGGTIFLGSDAASPAQVEALIFPGRLVDATDKQAFGVQGVNYVPGQFGAKVTGQLENPYAQPVNNVALHAILRDAAGAIIGGGSGFSDTLPAGGSAAVEVSVTSAGEVASVELYPVEASITKVGE